VSRAALLFFCLGFGLAEANEALLAKRFMVAAANPLAAEAGAAVLKRGGSALDATPYQLRPDAPADEQPYTQQNFGATLGGRMVIPGLISGTRTNFTFSYTGGHGATLFDQYATVPTPDARAGNLSGLSGTLVDPTTGQPFAGNVIPPDRISGQAQSLLPYIPLPNLPGTQRNYHYTTTTQSNNNAFNARVTHVFGGGAVEEATWTLFPDADTLALMATGEHHVRTTEDRIIVVYGDVPGAFSRIARWPHSASSG